MNMREDRFDRITILLKSSVHCTIGCSALDAKSDPNGLKKSRHFAQVPVSRLTGHLPDSFQYQIHLMSGFGVNQALEQVGGVGTIQVCSRS